VARRRGALTTGADERSPLTRYLEWCKRRNLRPSTIDQRRRALRRLARACDEVPLLELTGADLEDWWEDLDRLTPEARAVELSHIRSFYKWALFYDLIIVDPTIKLMRPKLARRLPRPIDDERVAQALEEADPRRAAMFALAAFAGLRASDVAHLRAEDLRLHQEPPVAVLRNGKGGKDRVVPLSRVCIGYLRAYGIPARGFVFPRQDDTPGMLPPHRVSQICNDFLHRSLGFDETLHQFRHRFLTRLYGECKDLRLVQEIAGHSSPVTTAGYAAFSPDRAAPAVNGASRLRR
jgi:site-specific recombinase XerD